MINENTLLSEWIHEVILNYFKEEKQQYTDKLFLKISGFHPESFDDISAILKENLESLSQHYTPIIRTITPIAGLPEFQCHNHETSTWLRNNTGSNQALVLLINEVTPEAQSLESLFTIDEAYLLSDKGLDTLFNVLMRMAPDLVPEIETLKTFLLDMLYTIIDPQLKILLGFLISVLQSKELSIITKIQHNLPELGMFRDSKLEIKKSGIKKLRQNYYLSNLQSATSDLDISKLQEKLYSFVNREEETGLQDDIWDNNVKPEDLLAEANRFLSYQDRDFLLYEYDFVAKVFNFKISTTLKEQLKDIYHEKENEFSGEESQKYLEGIEEVNNELNSEAIQNFIEEFEEVLKDKKPVLKKLNRLVEKIRNPSEYDDIYKALLHSTFQMLEEHQEEQIDIHFILDVMDSQINTDIAKIIKIYLNNINNLVPRIKFNPESIIEIQEEPKDDNVQFLLRMFSNGEEITSRKFKVNSFLDLKILSIVSEFEKDYVPYIRNINEESERVIDIKNHVYNKIENYIVQNHYDARQHFDKYVSFLSTYLVYVQKAVQYGIFSLEFEEILHTVEDCLEGIHSSVITSSEIYKSIDLIGSIDYYEETDEYSLPSERVVTVFNPIRLLAYLKRYDFLNDQIEGWINRQEDHDNEIVELNEFLDYLVSRTHKLAPTYFTLGDSELLLIEGYEKFGESKYLVNTNLQKDVDYLANETSIEVVKTVKNYLEVYPYAKDGLDVMLMYCNSSEIVTRTIEAIFKSTKVTKLNLAVHSQKAAKLHHELNKWIEQKEEYNKPEVGKKVPKLELSVISGTHINDIKEQVSQRMVDADLVILIDYFGQHEQVKYSFTTPKNMDLTNDWFLNVYREPLNINESLKRISYVNEKLPKVLWDFYHLQYMCKNKALGQENVTYLLENIITINQHSHSSLLDFMHDRFNWVLILDRYLDRTLLQKATQKAQIIQYKSKAGKNNSLKLIVSSSKYIRKITQQMDDFDYYDRLNRKFISILKVQDINRDEVIQAVEKVKDISGALVLKVIGKGKFSHEMLATYLTTKFRELGPSELSLWSLCDELPWFVHNQRRPDLVLTRIQNEQGKIKLSFELIELKFINHHIFDRERHDAVKQLRTGMNLYDRLYRFDNGHIDADYWREQLVEYILERGAYTFEHVQLIKQFQQADLNEIQVDINGYIDVYCYTDNLTKYNFESVDKGIYTDRLEGDITNYIFNRSYILSQLGTSEMSLPVYTELETTSFNENLKPEDFFTQKVSASEQEEPMREDETQEISQSEDVTNEDIQDGQDSKKELSFTEGKLNGDTLDAEHSEIAFFGNEERQVNIPSDNLYPEKIAFSNLDIQHEQNEDINEALTQEFIRKLKSGFNQNDIHLMNERAIVGSSVVRIMFDLPKDTPQSKVTNKSKDIQLWLKLDHEPNIFINKDGINIDIVRENPDTIYFDEFMQEVRSQIQEEVKDTNLIAPLGLDPLNKVIYLDFASPTSPHLLTGGTSGSGKSVTLNSIILGMMCLYRPEQLQFIFIDPKQVEFSIYENRRHTQSVVTDIHEAVSVLGNVVNEMENRYTQFKNEMVTNLDEYIEEVGEDMPRLVVVFDEFADFMSQEKEIAKQVENSILRLGQKARAAGIHLIICTQNPKADIINTNIRNNLGARLALRAADATASTIILDEVGAEKLAGKGDFLAKVGSRTDRGKSPFLTVQLRRALLKYFAVNKDEASRV